MASTANDVSALDGNFKDEFHDKLNDIMPDYVVLQKDGFISWVPSDKLNGQLYSIPTLVKSNQGVTYLGEGGALSDLNDAVNGKMVEAQIKGTEINVRGQMTYKTLAQASSQGPKAFVKASSWLVDNLSSLAFTRLEIAALYGQTGLGTLESVTDNTTSAAFVITTATFAPGIWVGAEGAFIDSFTSTTKNNTGTLQISTVNVDTRTLTVLYSGTIANDAAAGDVLYFKGAYSGSTTWSEMIGLYKQITNTTSTLFNIDKSAYTLMQGSTYSNTNAITKAKLLDAAMLTVNKGNMSGLTALVSTKAWAKLAAEDLALRQFDGSYSESKSKSGSKALEYEYVGGSIKVLCHPMVKYGEIFLFNPDDVLWVGSTKGVTFEIPGMENKFFRLVQDKNAVELQAFADCALYLLAPCRAAVMTGITYS